ncbi:MAG: hypothetical protein QG583_705 [Patescibacteria group bacterium]|nr:hypothetical protein [Patescibacteria group bacterium]
MKKYFHFMFATMFAVFASPSVFAQSDDPHRYHLNGGYDEEMYQRSHSVRELQQQLNDLSVTESTFTDSTFVDSTLTKKEPVYQLHGENNIIRFNGGDTIYSVRVKKHPAELSRLCKELGIHADYESRMTNIVLPLCMQGVVLFDKTTDPYFLEEDIIDLKKHHGADWDCFFYRGTDQQNAKLIRNLNANRNLFQDGKLIPGAYLHWKLIE